MLGAIEIENRSAPADPVGYKIVGKALEKGLICRSVIYERQDALAIAPPFPIMLAQMDDMIEVIDGAIKAVD